MNSGCPGHAAAVISVPAPATSPPPRDRRRRMLALRGGVAANLDTVWNGGSAGARAGGRAGVGAVGPSVTARSMGSGLTHVAPTLRHAGPTAGYAVHRFPRSTSARPAGS
jgi:hypothetical protein